MSLRTRTTRSRSRAPEEDQTVPAAAPAASPSRAKAANGHAANGASNGTSNGTKHISPLQVGNGLAAPNGIPPLPQVVPEEIDARGRSDRTNFYQDRTLAHANGKYFWTPGEPDLHKVSVHLDTLTASDLAIRGVTTQLTENVASLNSTVQQLLDMNARLKRELREQKLNSNRRWIWAVLLLLAFTVGQGVVRSAIDTFVWATTNPQTFFPALLEGIQVMTSWCFILSFPLVLLLFIHSILNNYSVGALRLGRTIVYLLAGICMQVPLLYFLMQTGLVFLADLRSSPLFANSTLNTSVTIGLWLGTLLVDYVLLLLHGCLK